MTLGLWLYFMSLLRAAPESVRPGPWPGLAPPSAAPPSARYSIARLRELAALVGFPDPRLAAAVAMAESSGAPGAVGDGGTSFGLWQIHVPSHPEYTAESLRDPVANAKAAFRVSRGGTDWTPWTCWKNGAFSQWMGDEA